MQVLFQLSYSPTERGVYQRPLVEPAGLPVGIQTSRLGCRRARRMPREPRVAFRLRGRPWPTSSRSAARSHGRLVDEPDGVLGRNGAGSDRGDASLRDVPVVFKLNEIASTRMSPDRARRQRSPSRPHGSADVARGAIGRMPRPPPGRPAVHQLAGWLVARTLVRPLVATHDAPRRGGISVDEDRDALGGIAQLERRRAVVPCRPARRPQGTRIGLARPSDQRNGAARGSTMSTTIPARGGTVAADDLHDSGRLSGHAGTGAHVDEDRPLQALQVRQSLA